MVHKIAQVRHPMCLRLIKFDTHKSKMAQFDTHESQVSQVRHPHVQDSSSSTLIGPKTPDAQLYKKYVNMKSYKICVATICLSGNFKNGFIVVEVVL